MNVTKLWTIEIKRILEREGAPNNYLHWRKQLVPVELQWRHDNIHVFTVLFY